jgi:hypothetical protein
MSSSPSVYISRVTGRRSQIFSPLTSGRRHRGLQTPIGPYPEDFPIDQLPHLAIRAPDIQAVLTVLGRRTPSPPHRAAWISLDLPRTDLRRGALMGADLQRARLRRASLAKAWMFKADLRGADLRDADLRGAALREAIADLTTWWPDEHYDPKTAGIHVHPDLEQADLRGAFLRRDDLTGISLRGARANAFTDWPTAVSRSLRLVE